MISKYLCVLFIYIFCYHTTLAIKLKFIFTALDNVIKCSTHEYLIYNNWSLLSTWNISCPNATHLFEIDFLNLPIYDGFVSDCHENNKTFSTYIRLKSTNPCESPLALKLNDTLSQLTGIVSNLTHQHPFQAKCVGSEIVIELGSQSWLTAIDGIHTLFMIFDSQPIICRIKLMRKVAVKNNQCVQNSTGRVELLCYYEPGTENLPISVNLSQINNFLTYQSYGPYKWKEKGGFYYDDRLLTIGTTASTTEIFTPEPTTLLDSTSDTTVLSTTSVIVPITTFTEIETTATSDNPTLIMSTNSDTLKTSIGKSTSAIILSMHTSKIVSPTITSTKLSTTTRKSRTSKSSLSMIALNSSSPTNQSSSRLKYPLFFLLFMLGIIVLILFFIFRFRPNRDRDDPSLLDRSHSDESVTSESELDPSSEYDEQTMSTELNKIDNKRKSGRMVSQLDPDIL